MFGVYGRWFSDAPTKSELEKCTIDELVGLAKSRKRIKRPFKKFLIKYIISLGILNK
jgi:hypothetical protein